MDLLIHTMNHAPVLLRPSTHARWLATLAQRFDVQKLPEYSIEIYIPEVWWRWLWEWLNCNDSPSSLVSLSTNRASRTSWSAWRCWSLLCFFFMPFLSATTCHSSSKITSLLVSKTRSRSAYVFPAIINQKWTLAQGRGRRRHSLAPMLVLLLFFFSLVLYLNGRGPTIKDAVYSVPPSCTPGYIVSRCITRPSPVMMC